VTAPDPILSVGLPVRNGREIVGRCIDSVLSQDFGPFELVISDNDSEDDTPELLHEYARADGRIRLNFNESNLGIHGNINRVLDLSRGTYFRWISSDDWLEPGCLSACVGALRAHEDAIGVTAAFTIHSHCGSTISEQYRGEFPTSPDPARRFERMLWFFLAGDAKYDPLYGVYRRDVLQRSRRQHGSEQTDWLLAAELALSGPILHLDQILAHRTRDYVAGADRAALRERLDPERVDELKSSSRRLRDDLLELVEKADLTEEQRRRCRRALWRFSAREAAKRGRAKASGLAREVLRR